MELGLSLGDPPKTCGFLSKLNNNTAIPSAAAAATSSSLGFCMALGINQDQEKSAQEDDINQDDDDDDDDEISEDVREPPVQLDLLPLVPVRSDNGSSEGGSSGNAPAVRGFDVNRMPALPGAEEATSSFRMEFGMYKAGNISGNKRSNMEPTGNDVAVEAERASSRASDEDENGLSRKKLRLSKEQSAYLEESFKEHNTLNPKQKLALAKQLNLRPRQVEVWFQNRRARTKLKQTEVDCEYLKRCCETLTEENRRLHKELQELRALKNTSNPFYMQLPATTLTMCPSCERVATATTTAAAATNSAAAAAAAPPSTTNNNNSNNNPSPISSSKPRFYPFSKATSPQPSTTHSHPPTTPS